MMVKEVEGLNAESLERTFDHPPDVIAIFPRF
jgi:hypothetical protein